MKIFLLHGDDSDKSYNRLTTFISEARKRNWELVYLDESPLSVSENISSASLFSDNRFLIHRNYSRISKKDLEFIYEKSDKYEGNMVFYSDSELPKTALSKLPKSVKIELFKLPVLIWKFLDSVYPGNAKNVTLLYRQIIPDKPPEFVFGLLARLVKDLYWVKISPGTIPYPQWRTGKLKSQANRFLTDSLENFIDRLATIDIRTKTSGENMADLLKFVLATELG